MLDAGLSPRVFDVNKSVGGLWSPNSQLCRPSMRTNLSKHTNCFSDLAWPENTPVFPSALQVGKYLASYANKYLPAGVIRLNCRVMSAEYSSTGKWQVQWCSDEGKESAEFDFCIFACGFFSKLYIPEIPGLLTFTGTLRHSSTYTSPDEFKDKNVVIVGGSLSSVEVAEDIAPYAASIHHIIPRPFWVLPKYLPLDPENPGTTFLPLDLVLYRRHQPTISEDVSPQARWRKVNENLRSLCGELSDVSESMKIDVDMPPYAAVSDLYANYVRSGRIMLHPGRLTRITNSELTLNDQTTLPEEINHIIFATGFRPSSSSNILSPSILSALDFSEEEMFLPILLHRATLHPSLPNAAFVGHYRGPYWGIIELQARWCAGLFSGSLPWPSLSEMREGIAAEERMRNSRPRTQWPRGDYVGFGSDLAETIGISLPPHCLQLSKQSVKPHHVFVPSHFTPPLWLQQTHVSEVNTLQKSLEETLSLSANSALFVAAAVFRALHGRWTLNRIYSSRLPEYPSGPSTGTAEFIPRKASRSDDSQNYKIEYLYSEKTLLTTSTGLQLQGSQQYIYQYDEPHDKLEVYFAKRDEAATLDYLFHQVNFEPHSDSSPWKAKSSHFCSPDNYEVEYTFFFKGSNLEKWNIEYEVKGPRKDYHMETWYSRT